MAATQIHLYTAQTPNGIKISILLEELGLQYKVSSVKFSESEQKKPAFLEINPNGRIPALTDTFTDGKEIRVFESGSIMQYLVDRYDTEHRLSYPAGSREHIETTNWLFFQNAGVGPMQGQANHFTRYAPAQIEYGVNRYQNETRRLYGVLDKHLADSGAPYIVGEKCTIADIAHWGWVAAAAWAGVEINDFPALKAWEERMWARPALKKGADVPQPYKMKELLQDKERMEAEAAKSRAWVQQGMKEDAEKHGSMSSCVLGALQSSGSIKMSESDALLPKRHVVKFEEGDHDDPRNWPSWRKLLAWLPIVPVDLAVSFGASGYSPVADQVSETFAVSTQTAVLGLSIYTLALAFGPLLNAPVSENYGRLPVYVVLYGLSLPFFAGTALAPSWTVFLVMRFFTGLFQSVTIANLGGTIADLYDFQHTGVPMSIFIWAATGGSSIGYLLLSIVAQHRPWQDVFWTLLTICGLAWAVMCCCIVYAGETRQSVLLRRIAEKRQQETGERQDVPEEYKSKGLKHLIVAIQARPLRFLFTEAIISCAAAYNGYLYGISFLLNGAFALVFGDGHKLNTMQIGLCFAGVIVGISLGPLTNLLQDRYYRRVSRGVNKPEARLQFSKVAAVALPLSLFWFAWTSYTWIHPVVPVLATVIWGWSFFTLILMTYMYTEDSYGEYSGSALAALGFVRNTAGAAFPLFGRQMYDKLGYQWASTTLAFLALIMVPIPFFLDSLGKRLRKRSPYASEQFDPAEE